MRLAALNTISKTHSYAIPMLSCATSSSPLSVCVCYMRFTGQTQCTVALLTDASSSLFAAATQRAQSASVYHTSHKKLAATCTFFWSSLETTEPFLHISICGECNIFFAEISNQKIYK